MASRIWDCGSRCPKIPFALSSNALPKRTRLKQWQRTSQVAMRHFHNFVCFAIAFAAALASRDADGGLPLADVQSVDPSIAVELRYAGPNNLTGHALYPVGTRALVRPKVASALAVAQMC